MSIKEEHYEIIAFGATGGVSHHVLEQALEKL